MLAYMWSSSQLEPGDLFYQAGFYVGTGKGPRPFKSAWISRRVFRGLVIYGREDYNGSGLNRGEFPDMLREILQNYRTLCLYCDRFFDAALRDHPEQSTVNQDADPAVNLNQ
jgi:hypothetical protein